MKIKLYVDYVDGRKVCYVKNMSKSAVGSNIEFDYYVEIKRDPKIAKMFAVVIDDDGKTICTRKVQFPWKIEQYGDRCYFGITICGTRVVSDTVTTLNNRHENIEYGYVIKWCYDEHGHIKRDHQGNPIGKTIRVRLEHNGAKAIINEQAVNPNVLKLMGTINSII